jgi:hypothetical protein
MFVRKSSGPSDMVSAVVLADSSGVPITDQIDLGNGNLDGFCMYDPGFQQLGSPNYVEGFITGTPRPSWLALASPHLHTSVWRCSPGGNPTQTAFMTGWNGGAPQADFVFHILLFGTVTLPVPTFPLLDPIIVAAVHARAGTEPAGGRIVSSIGLPVPLEPLSNTIFIEHQMVSVAPTVSGWRLEYAIPVDIRY